MSTKRLETSTKRLKTTTETQNVHKETHNNHKETKRAALFVVVFFSLAFLLLCRRVAGPFYTSLSGVRAVIIPPYMPPNSCRHQFSDRNNTHNSHKVS